MAADAVDAAVRQEQVERLAGFMGWDVKVTPGGTAVATLPNDAGRWRLHGPRRPSFLATWCPFTDANAEAQLRERAADVWAESIDGTRYTVAYMRRLGERAEAAGKGRGIWSQPSAAVSTVLEWHRTGDIAHAVLAVLDSAPAPTGAPTPQE